MQSAGDHISRQHHHPHQLHDHAGQHHFYAPTFPTRFAGDGLDMRRPVTSTHAEPLPEAPLLPSNFVDLTGSDELEAEPDTAQHSQPERSRRQTHGRTSDRPPSRMPRYPNEIFGTAEVIDLEREAENAAERRGRRQLPRVTIHPSTHPPTSPEIEFIGIQPRPHLPPPPMPTLRPSSAGLRIGKWR